MKSHLRRLGLLVIVGVFGLATSPAQDLAKQLSQMGSDAAKGYVTPFGEALGAGLNSGFYYDADIHGILGFDIGLKVGATSFGDLAKTYTFNTPAQMTVGGQTLNRNTNYDASIVAPTAIGASGGKALTIRNSLAALNGDTLFSFPGGVKEVAGMYPSAATLQASVGLPFGIEVMGRFIPSTKVGDFGKINLSGFGVRYDIDQWIPVPLPVDIAIHFATQKLTLKDVDGKRDVLSATGTAYGIEASVGLLFFDVYAGFQLEKSTVTLGDYEYTDPATKVIIPLKGFGIEGKNKSRITVGGTFTLLIVKVHAEYNMAEVPTAAVGLAVAFR